MRHAPDTHLHREVYTRTPEQIDREIRKRRGDYDVAIAVGVGVVVSLMLGGVLMAWGAM